MTAQVAPRAATVGALTLVIPVLVLLASCSSAPAGAEAGDAPTSSRSSRSTAEELTWPPTAGTDGAWLAVPEQLVAPAGDVEACGTTITADYAPGVQLEYQAEVSGPTTTVRYRAAGPADVDLVRADGTSVVVDVAGPSTETYTDQDGDGEWDSQRVELTGGALFVASTPGEHAAMAAAGMPDASYWADGAVTVQYDFPTDASTSDGPVVVVTGAAPAVQDVCGLLDETAPGEAATVAALDGPGARVEHLQTPR